MPGNVDRDRWGEPTARSRFAELRKLLLTYCDRYGRRPEMKHAGFNWRHDADYVNDEWRRSREEG